MSDMACANLFTIVGLILDIVGAGLASWVIMINPHGTQQIDGGSKKYFFLLQRNTWAGHTSIILIFIGFILQFLGSLLK